MLYRFCNVHGDFDETCLSFKLSNQFHASDRLSQDCFRMPLHEMAASINKDPSLRFCDRGLKLHGVAATRDAVNVIFICSGF